MQEINKNTDFDNDDLIENLFKIKEEIVLIISLIKKNIKILTIAALIGGILGFTNAYFSKPIYTANLNFMIGSSSGSTSISSQIAGLAGVLGVGNSNIGNSLFRMTELITSDKIITNSIFKTIDIDGSKDFIINHIIRLEELDKSWNESEDNFMHNISFDEDLRDKNISELSLSQRTALKTVKNIILPKGNIGGIISRYSDTKTGIIFLEASHTNEILAIELVNSLYHELLAFYTKESYTNAQIKVDALVSKVDSIQKELNRVQNIVGSTSDKTLGLIMKEDKVDLKHLVVQEQILTIMYGEAQKNLETFRVMKDTENPPLTLLDYPFSPINPSSKSKLFYLIFGSFLLFFILLIYYRFKLIYKDKLSKLFN